MGLNDSNIPDKTIETLARSFFRDSLDYGFKKIDYLRFVNAILDIAMKNSGALVENSHSSQHLTVAGSQQCCKLPLEGERLLIRNFTPSDLDLLKQWMEDVVGREFVLSRTTAKTMDVEDFVHHDCCILGIITLKNGNPVGAVAYCDHNSEQHRAELRKIIGDPSQRRMGYAREATQLWIQYCRQFLKLKKIYLSTLNTNIRNIKLNEELGFQVEGILRNEVFFDGRFHDVLRMGLFID